MTPVVFSKGLQISHFLEKSWFALFRFGSTAWLIVTRGNFEFDREQSSEFPLSSHYSSRL